MTRHFGLLRRVLTLAPTVLAVVLAGCAKPPVPATQFIGTWILPEPGTGKLKPGASATLILRPDGTGELIPYPDPHGRDFTWLLRADKMITTDRDGSESKTYGYRFNSRDELVLVMEGGVEASFRRYTGSPPGAGAAAPAATQPGGKTAPTTGGSARPPERSRH